MTSPDVLLLDVMGTLVYDPFHRVMPDFFGMSLEQLLDAKHPEAWVRFEHGEMGNRPHRHQARAPKPRYTFRLPWG